MTSTDMEKTHSNAGWPVRPEQTGFVIWLKTEGWILAIAAMLIGSYGEFLGLG